MSAEKHPLQTLIEDTAHFFFFGFRVYSLMINISFPEGNLIFLKDEGFPHYWNKDSI